jgi:hypothetical protein
MSKYPTAHTNLPLIEVAEDWLLDALLSDQTASRYILRRLSATVALVRPGSVDALLTRLQKLGHTPRVLDR